MSKEPKKGDRLTVGPRMFISGPYVDCPKCHERSFGVLSIFPASYTRRCLVCLYPLGSDDSTVFELPMLKKALVYIDQFAVSDMMKAINRTAFADKQVRHEWLTLFEKLDSLCKLQLLACPESFYHHQESYVSEYYAALKQMYEHLSCGVRFHPGQTIQRSQILRHVKRWLQDKDAARVEIDREQALSGNADAWQEVYRIGIESDYVEEWAEEMRHNRNRVHESMKSLFASWQNVKNFRFEEHYDIEISDSVPQFVKLYSDRIFDLCYQKLGDAELAQNTTVEYFGATNFSAFPCNRISSLLFSALARRAASGQKQPPNQGMVTDIGMVSALLPYCDAMFVDKEMDILLHEGGVKDRLGFDVPVFSLRSIDEFFVYLDKIRASASDEHMSAVQEVYGSDRIVPFTKMYE